MTALHFASKNYAPAVVKLLLDSSRIDDVNRRDGEGKSALYYAVERAYDEIVKMFVKYPGIDVTSDYVRFCNHYVRWL